MSNMVMFNVYMIFRLLCFLSGMRVLKYMLLVYSNINFRCL